MEGWHVELQVCHLVVQPLANCSTLSLWQVNAYLLKWTVISLL